MKKIYVMAAFLGATSFAFNQVQNVPMQYTKNTDKALSTKTNTLKAPGISIWSDDFSTPGNWTIGTNTGGITGASSGTGTTIDQALTNPGTSVETIEYIVTPTSVTGTCVGAPYSIVVTVNPTIPVSVTITGQSQVCSGTEVNYASFPAGAGTSPTFAWKVNGNVLGTSNNFSYTPANTEVITCEVTPGIDVTCPSASPAISDPIVMIVTESVTPSITITATTSNEVCAGSPVSFTAEQFGGGGNPQYQWKVNGINNGPNSSSACPV